MDFQPPQRRRAVWWAAGLLLLCRTAAAGVAPPPPPDPATSTTYGCHFIQNWVWNYGGDGVPAVTLKLRYPSATCVSADGPPAGSPVLVFAHGVGMGYNDHRYLMAHLARNGFVTLSVENSGDNETRARTLISALNAVHAFWSWRDRLSPRTAFMGHSRGGEAAVTAARLLDQEPALDTQGFDVRAVVSIAPTDGGGSSGSDPFESLDGAMTRGYLAIYGSHDEDVFGSAANVGVNLAPQRTAFALYDRAGSEVSSEGLVLGAPFVDKALVFVHGLTHRAFLDADPEGGGPGALGGTEDGRNVAKAYVLSFLRWKVQELDVYRAFLDGGEQPATLAGLTCVTQFSAGRRRVLDNFQDDSLGANTLGGSVLQSPTGILTFMHGPLHELVKSSPHATRGARATWVNHSWLRWSLPNSSPPFVGPLRDVSSYGYLSLRVAQVYGNIYNTPGVDLDFHVQLYTGSGYSAKVLLSDHGRLPYPDPFICPSAGCGAGTTDYAKSAMTTVRIPLEAFSGADLHDVRYVYLVFDAPGYSQGAITIDSLEFSD